MGLRPTQGDENGLRKARLAITPNLSSRPERSEVERSAVSHIWRKERARCGAPSIGGGFRSALRTALGCPIPAQHRNTWKCALKEESGQALVFMLLCMTCILGFVGFATDVGMLLRAKRVVQTAADSGAVAGAAELGQTDLTPTAAALAATAQNGITNGSNGATVTVNIPPQYATPAHTGSNCGPGGDAPCYVEVIVSQKQPTFFMKVFQNLFNLGPITVSARAVAALAKSNGCTYTLGSSGPGIAVTGNATMDVPNCGIFDDSNSGNALDISGNAALNAKAIGVAGSYSNTGNGSVTPTPIPGMVPESDPLASLPEPSPSSYPSCSAYQPGSKTLTQGCYSGIMIAGNTTLNLNPGLYVIDGDLTLSGNITVTGTDVTIYLMGGTNISSNVTLDLTAPTSGVYNGVLFFQSRSNSNPAVIGGNSGSTLEGILYFPNASLTVTGNSGSTIYSDFIAQSLTLNGNASFQDYALVNGSSILTAARLVE